MKENQIQRNVLCSKIHRARVTAADLHYVGSVSIDSALMETSGILPWEKVHVVDVTNGARLETYAIPAAAGSGTIQLNGAAAHLIDVDDLVIIMSYVTMPDEQARQWKPTVVHVDLDNQILEVVNPAAGTWPTGEAMLYSTPTNRAPSSTAASAVGV